eukprot:TRINITY_DN6481_c0_g1_i3.p1 TRINITY_DN6481_c0_g1~~TRINITY_DN6481_c0_g1_i3.p1  ORF type:complete len:778 (+),score=165.60 TRINITY_DN6481_c0_g1_i3:54-2387(+)
MSLVALPESIVPLIRPYNGCTTPIESHENRVCEISNVADLERAIESYEESSSIDYAIKFTSRPPSDQILCQIALLCKRTISLDLSGMALSDDILNFLEMKIKESSNDESPSLSKLQILRLSGNILGDASMISLGRMLIFSNAILSICLRFNNIGYIGAKDFAISLSQFQKLQTLDLSHNRIGDKGVNELSRILASHRNIRDLRLASNSITPTGLEILFKAISQTGIESLDVSSNPLNSEGTASTFEYLFSGAQRSLKSLDVSSTEIGDEVFCLLFKRWSEHDGLQCFIAKNNQATDVTAASLAECIRNRRENFTTLNLESNCIEKDGVISILKAYLSRPIPKRVVLSLFNGETSASDYWEIDQVLKESANFQSRNIYIQKYIHISPYVIESKVQQALKNATIPVAKETSLVTPLAQKDFPNADDQHASPSSRNFKGSKVNHDESTQSHESNQDADECSQKIVSPSLRRERRNDESDEEEMEHIIPRSMHSHDSPRVTERSSDVGSPLDRNLSPSNKGEHISLQEQDLPTLEPPQGDNESQDEEIPQQLEELDPVPEKLAVQLDDEVNEEILSEKQDRHSASANSVLYSSTEAKMANTQSRRAHSTGGLHIQIPHVQTPTITPFAASPVNIDDTTTEFDASTVASSQVGEIDSISNAGPSRPSTTRATHSQSMPPKMSNISQQYKGTLLNYKMSRKAKVLLNFDGQILHVRKIKHIFGLTKRIQDFQINALQFTQATTSEREFTIIHPSLQIPWRLRMKEKSAAGFRSCLEAGGARKV